MKTSKQPGENSIKTCLLPVTICRLTASLNHYPAADIAPCTTTVMSTRLSNAHNSVIYVWLSSLKTVAKPFSVTISLYLKKTTAVNHAEFSSKFLNCQVKSYFDLHHVSEGNSCRWFACKTLTTYVKQRSDR